MTSQITTSGWSRSIIAIASEPDAAARTWSPRLSSAFSTTFLTLRLSSTTRTFPIDVLLQNWRDGRVGAALVDSGGRAQQELLEIAMDRLHAVGGRRGRVRLGLEHRRGRRVAGAGQQEKEPARHQGILADNRAELVAVDVGHAHAAHDEIGSVTLEHRQREGAAGHGEDLVDAGLAERGL